ncbi:MAG: dihydroxyacetone kinase subunit L [bacterium]|nr:dihydroxyacetone kinase subunit L [bacterium]
MARGKAKPGEKTLIDSLHPAVEALQQVVADKKC